MLHVVILAAGEGKRMRSAQPKVLQPLAGRPMLCHLIDTVASLSPARIDVVVGAGAEQVEQALSPYAAQLPVHFPMQRERLGTGHAAQQALAHQAVDDSSRVLILSGDMPLVRAETLQALLASEADLALLSFMADDPTGYGRVLRDEAGAVIGIREQRDANDSELAIQEVNSGVLCATTGALRQWLAAIKSDNAQGEYYLTDCMAIAAGKGYRVEALPVAAADELMGANDRAQLAALEQAFQQRARQALMADGAQLLDPDTVYVRGAVTVGADVCIDAGVVLNGEVCLGEGVSIGVGCVITDTELAAGTRVEPYCVLDGVRTEGACQVGPFARLRPDTVLSAEVRIGNFVEVKNSHFATGAKANHLSYVGDAEVGAAANIGAGTITCNYDGANKHRTEIGAGAFIGSNSALVAPVKVGEGATIGAGSTISKDAPEQALTLTRAPQQTIPGWPRPRKGS